MSGGALAGEGGIVTGGSGGVGGGAGFAPGAPGGEGAAGWGRIDILVANAGVNTKERALHNISQEQWEYVIGVNLNGVFNCAKSVLPTMRAQRDGLIIVVS